MQSEMLKPTDSAGLVERLNRNAGWRNAQWQCITDPALLTEAAHHIAAQDAEIARLRGEVAVIQQSHDWLYTEKGRLENALKDIASRAHANLANPETGHD